MESIADQLQSKTQLKEQIRNVVFQVSLMEDLYTAIEGLALSKGVTKSKIIEGFLLENPTIIRYLRALRTEPKHVPLVAPEQPVEDPKKH